MKVFLETERLVLREFTAADGSLLVELDSDPEVMRYLTGGEPTSPEVVYREVLPKFLASYGRFDGLGYWAAQERASGGFVGWFALHPADDRDAGLELGYRLRQAEWGKGYATEGARALVDAAFERFGAVRVFGQTYEDNLASRRVMEKAGMRFVRAFQLVPEDLATGTFDASGLAVWDGDDVEYAIERTEWASARQPFGG